MAWQFQEDSGEFSMGTSNLHESERRNEQVCHETPIICHRDECPRAVLISSPYRADRLFCETCQELLTLRESGYFAATSIQENGEEYRLEDVKRKHLALQRPLDRMVQLRQRRQRWRWLITFVTALFCLLFAAALLSAYFLGHPGPNTWPRILRWLHEHGWVK